MIEFKGIQFERDVILWAVRWFVAYPVSHRQLEEMMEEHGFEVHHAKLNRWVLKYVPLLVSGFPSQDNGTIWRVWALTRIISYARKLCFPFATPAPGVKSLSWLKSRFSRPRKIVLRNPLARRGTHYPG